jgi:hypothetical protein
LPTNSAAIRVGHLLELTVDDGYGSVADVDRMFKAIEKELTRVPEGVKHVVVADFTRCPVMSPEAAERLVWRMTQANSRVERSGILASRAASGAVLQFVRLIREAGHPDRRLFFDAAELLPWMNEKLDPAESARLKRMLIERSQLPDV